MSIPKIIHYCWFGGNPKPKLVQKCIRSWKKYCPDYKIVEWNESNFDVNIIPYCREAYHAKKWAFVSDYARLFIIHKYGGIYMDTDVELIKPLDQLLDLDCFLGFQHEKYVNNGLILGAVNGNSFVKKNAEIYERLIFEPHIDSNHFVVCQEYTTNLLANMGLTIPDTGALQIVDNVTIFPSEYFCPYDHRTFKLSVTANTYAIHHFASSWWDSKRKKEYYDLKRKVTLDYYFHLPHRIGRKLLGNTVYERIKKQIKR